MAASASTFEGVKRYLKSTAVLLVIVAISAGVALHLVITRTALGAAIRACGENPHVALVLGVNVLKVRLTAGVIGFFVMGVGASLFVLLWQKYWDMRIYLLGYGWLAFTIALAAGRHPLVLIPLALVFGGLVEFDVKLQATLGLQRDLVKNDTLSSYSGTNGCIWVNKTQKGIWAPAKSRQDILH